MNATKKFAGIGVGMKTDQRSVCWSAGTVKSTEKCVKFVKTRTGVRIEISMIKIECRRWGLLNKCRS